MDVKTKQRLEADLNKSLIPAICKQISEYFDYSEQELRDWRITLHTGRIRHPNRDRLYSCPDRVSLSVDFVMRDCKRTTKTKIDYDACMKWKCDHESHVVFAPHE